MFDAQNGLPLGLGSIPALAIGGTDSGPAHGPSLLMETGDYLLLESGDTILLE